MSSIVHARVGISRPYHQMCCTGTYFVVAAGAPIRLDGPGGRDGTHVVFVAVGPRFDSAKGRP